jgi:hypothetical protein
VFSASLTQGGNGRLHEPIVRRQLEEIFSKLALLLFVVRILIDSSSGRGNKT